MKRVLLILGIALLFIYPVQAGCEGVIGACGEGVDVQGHGAVALCESDCFVCGASDGVCPEDFSDGSTRDGVEMLIKVPVDERPVGFTDYQSNFETGNEACSETGGTCVEVQESPDGDSWGASYNTCDTPWTFMSDDNYYRAICDDVPVTPSCSICADPDCRTNLRGYAYDINTNEPLENALIGVTSAFNNDVFYLETSESDGSYDFEVARGQLQFSCGYDKYYPVADQEINLQRGSNTVDCALEGASCTQDCTLPNEFGVDICRSECEGDNNCVYQTTEFEGETYDARDICSNRPLGSFQNIGRINNTHTLGVTCCSGSFTTVYNPRFTIDADNVKNLLTREYRRLLDGEPVTVKIIVYNE